MEIIAFTKVKLPYGWLGNMAPYSVTHEGLNYKTSEALFQALRFKDFPEIAEKIRTEKSPMSAKMVAKGHKGILDNAGYEFLGQQDITYMKICLQAKLNEHLELKQMLLDTGISKLVEDCSSRPQGSGLFWGAALQEGKWVGRNILGRMWMEERTQLSLENKTANKMSI